MPSSCTGKGNNKRPKEEQQTGGVVANLKEVSVPFVASQKSCTIQAKEEIGGFFSFFSWGSGVNERPRVESCGRKRK